MTGAEFRPLFADLRILVRLALVEFWQRALPEDQGPLPLLRRELGQQLGTETLPDWLGFRDSLAERLPGIAHRPWGQLMEELHLNLPDLFLLALLGEVESAHSVNMTLSELQAPERSGRPSVHLVSALLESLFGPERGEALALPDNPLVTAGLVGVVGEGPLPLRYLRLPPTVWSVLGGQPTPWPGCHFVADPREGDLAQRSEAEADECAAQLAAERRGDGPAGVVVRGVPDSGRLAFAARLAKALDRLALAVPRAVWEREPALSRLCDWAGWLPVLRPDLGPGEVFAPGETSGPVVVILGTDGGVRGADLIHVSTVLPSRAERGRLWARALGDSALGRQLGNCALLSGRTIRALGTGARRLAEREGRAPTLTHVHRAHRQQGAEKLRLLAEPVERTLDDSALVMPAAVRESLAVLLRRARHRESVWEGLGPTLRATPNPGVRALFVGESGTGKTLAASFVASELGAPLYRVDLSSVMNKYIGESEKNLAQLLDQAAATDVVLLFDEADSLFGKRSEGKETGERFANMLTNFLLSRIETHPGVVLLTTNSRERIDTAFNRRIDLVVEFPRPDFIERLALWCSHLGDRSPGDSVCRALASYSDLAGGQVRNAVLAAATRAGGDGAIGAGDLLFGLRLEYDKLGRPVPAQLRRLAEVNPETEKEPRHA